MTPLLKTRVESRLRALNINAFEAARRSNLERNFVNDILNDKKMSLRADNLSKLARGLECSPDYFLLSSADEPESHTGNTPDLPSVDLAQEYVSVEILPTYAGMGGGGTGEGDVETALISRRLVEEELRARPSDLLLINVRGPSMEPLFLHGDQILVDKRDRSPTQPGPFAVFFPDGYVVKDVSWVEKRTKIRLSSRNPEYPAEEYDPDEVLIQIIGRPVWFARRL